MMEPGFVDPFIRWEISSSQRAHTPDFEPVLPKIDDDSNPGTGQLQVSLHGPYRASGDLFVQCFDFHENLRTNQERRDGTGGQRAALHRRGHFEVSAAGESPVTR